MKLEIIGMCPCCAKSQNGANVDIIVNRNDEGDLTNMYIFGDDDFDVPARSTAITDIEVSSDGKNITEIVCPRCKENIAVMVPVIKRPNNVSFKNRFNIMRDSGIAEPQPGM